MNFIDLFAGAGGLSEGFIWAGFNPVAHVEMNKEACDTLRTRLSFHYLNKKNNLNLYYNYISGEIPSNEFWSKIPNELLQSIINDEITNNSIGNIFNRIDLQLGSQKVDVLVGGPPCQAYSLVGRSRDPHRMKQDKRNYLFRYYARFLMRYKPQYFVFENVLGLLTAGNSWYFQEMINLFSYLGYSTDVKVLNAGDFGVLQKRRRVFIIGRKGKAKFKFPELNRIENNWQTKRDLFFDLPSLQPGQVMNVAKYTKPTNDYLKETSIRNGVDFVTQHITRQHNDRDLEIYERTINRWLNDRMRLKYNDLPSKLQTHHNTRSFLDRFKVVDPIGHSHTVVAHISKDGHYYIYPDLKQIRSISVREAARIQSFPDDYFFEGGRTAAFKQIGNAVPPQLSNYLAKELKNNF